MQKEIAHIKMSYKYIGLRVLDICNKERMRWFYEACRDIPIFSVGLSNLQMTDNCLVS